MTAAVSEAGRAGIAGVDADDVVVADVVDEAVVDAGEVMAFVAVWAAGVEDVRVAASSEELAGAAHCRPSTTTKRCAPDVAGVAPGRSQGFGGDAMFLPSMYAGALVVRRAVGGGRWLLFWRVEKGSMFE